MRHKKAKMLAEYLGDEYEAHLDPKVKHFAVIVLIGVLSWAAIARAILWVLR